MQENEVLKKRRPQSDLQSSDGGKTPQIDKLLLTQIKQRRSKGMKKLSKKSTQESVEKETSKKGGDGNEMEDYLDMKKDETNSAMGDFRMPFDFEESLFDKYYSLSRDDLSHLFLHNDSTSVKFGNEE